MRQKVDLEKKIQIPRSIGLAYDLTRSFNYVKENKAGAALKKQRQTTDNIINPNMEPLLMLDTYEMEDKLSHLNKMKSCKEVYEKKMFENEKVHVKVEELNSEAFQVISEIEDDLIKMKKQAPREESYVSTEGRKNVRTNISLRLHDIAKEIRDINMEFLLKSEKHKSTESDWYQKAGFDKEIADIIADRIIDEEKGIESIAKRRNDDITNIAVSVEKISSQFKQLHNLIIEQGTIVDRIDYNIEKASEYTNKGKSQLSQADKRGKNSSGLARRVILIQTIIIVILCFLLYLKLSKKRR